MFLDTGRDVQSMQTLEELAILFGFSQYINRIRGRIDHRRSGDTDFGDDTIVTINVSGRDRGDSVRGIDKAPLPQGISSDLRIGIQSINAIVFRNDVDHIMKALAWDSHVGHIERLPINIAVD